jgi:hypothetical protein
MTKATEPAARPAAPPRRRRRRWILVTLVLLGLFGWWWVDRQLEPNRLAATVLGRAGAALDLELTIDGTPEYALRPEPRLLLPNFVARMPGAATPLLTAKRVEVSLPWSTITGGDAVVITRVELDHPLLDLRALAAWQATRPPSEPFELPTLTNGLAVRDGGIVGDGWSIDELALALPRLQAGEPATATLAGTFRMPDQATSFAATLALEAAGLATPLRLEAKGEHTTATRKLPYAATLTGTLDATGDAIELSGFALAANGRLVQDGTDAAWKLAAGGDFALAGGDIALDPLTIAIDAETPLPDFSAKGALHLGDADTRVDLAGELTQWPDTWPALPEPVAADAPLAFRIAYAGARDFAAPMTLDVERGEIKLHSVLVLAEMRRWLQAQDGVLLPPLAGELTVPSLTVGGVTLEGVRIRVIDEDIGPEGPPTEGIAPEGAPTEP